MLCFKSSMKVRECHPVKIHQEKQHWKDQVYKNRKNLANAITLASSNEFWFYCLQYAQFIRLLERLLTLHCGAEEEFVQRFRRSVTIQSKKHLIEPVQYDEQGMAFSTSEGNDILWGENKFRENWETIIIFTCYHSLVFSWFIWFFWFFVFVFLLLLHWIF